MEEIWKPIIIEKYDFSDIYEVSNYGKVRNIKTNRILKTQKNKCSEYIAIGLYKNGKCKRFYIHRLVATMFIPNIDNLPYVNHKDENKSNNCVDNLEWCTQEYNNNYGTRKKREWETRRKNGWSLTWKQKKSQSVSGDKNPRARKVMCLETKQVFTTIKEAEQWLGKGIKHCLAGRNKTAGGYHWRYVEEEDDIEC